MSSFHYFAPSFALLEKNYAEVLGNIWAVEGDIPSGRLQKSVKFNPLHFTLNILFQGTDRAEFEMHVILLSSVHSLELDTTAHQVAA